MRWGLEGNGAQADGEREVETITTFKIRVPADMNLPDDIHVYLPRRGRSARPGLPAEWAVIAADPSDRVVRERSVVREVFE